MEGAPVSEDTVAESEVESEETTVPRAVERALGVSEGDRLRWTVGEDGRVEVVVASPGTFADFEPFDDERRTDAATEHDEWGVE